MSFASITEEVTILPGNCTADGFLFCVIFVFVCFVFGRKDNVICSLEDAIFEI